MKKITLLLIPMLLSSLIMACGTDGGGDAMPRQEFTYWLAIGESSFFYPGYEENPVLSYILDNNTFTDSEGVETRIGFDFQVPATGSEVDTYNTMIATGTYLDVMDVSFGMPVLDMYEAGQLLDLTYYVENHMPHYKAFLESHPELAVYITHEVDGGRKHLQIHSAADVLDIYNQFAGYNYRRDWIVRYGTPPAEIWLLDGNNQKVHAPNPAADVPFSFHYTLDWDGNAIETTEWTDDVNPDSWVDNIIFPSGHRDPMYISDWEWMLEIFARAIADQGIDDGYVMSLYYPGYIANGELSNAFGGGGPLFYRNQGTGLAAFGAVEEGFKTYMQCLNQWWQNGWIDREFRDKTDVFFQIDETKVFQGKIGLWLGLPSQLGARMYSERQPFTHGAMVFGAPQPINDVYGPDAVKFVEPYVMFQDEGLIAGGIIVTDKAKDKDIAVLLGFIDYLYSDEGSILRTLGLNREQVADSQSPVYLQHGLTEGAYFASPGGKLRLDPVIELDDGGIRGAMTMTRLPGLTRNSLIEYSYTPTYVSWRENWMRYPSTGFFGGLFNSQVPQEEWRIRERTVNLIENEYMYIEVPKFIVGEYDFGDDYESFLVNLGRRGYQQVVDIHNETIIRLNQSLVGD